MATEGERYPLLSHSEDADEEERLLPSTGRASALGNSKLKSTGGRSTAGKTGINVKRTLNSQTPRIKATEVTNKRIRIFVFWTAVAICESATVLVIGPLVIVWCTTLLKGDVRDGDKTVHLEGDWRGKLATFNWHPLLMTWALVIFLMQAVLGFRVFSRLGLTNRSSLKRLHVVFHTIALVLTCVGLAATFKYHSTLNKAHLTSVHSWLGLTAALGLVLQFIAGAVLYLPDVDRGCVRQSIRQESAHWHKLCGVAIVLLAAAAVISGIAEAVEWHDPKSKGYPHSTVARVGQAIAIVLPFAIIAMGIILSRNEYRRRGGAGEVERAVPSEGHRYT